MIRMTIPMLAALPLVLSGCGGANAAREVAACEEAIRDVLTVPTSYERLSSSSRQEPMSWEEFAAAGFKDDSLEAKAGRAPARNFQPGVRRVVVEYKATNAANVPIRSRMSCVFPTRDGEVASSAPLLKLQMKGPSPLT